MPKQDGFFFRRKRTLGNAGMPSPTKAVRLGETADAIKRCLVQALAPPLLVDSPVHFQTQTRGIVHCLDSNALLVKFPDDDQRALGPGKELWTRFPDPVE